MNLLDPPETTRIRLAIVEDETLVREGLVSLFQSIPNVECTLAVGDRLSALREAEFAPPDVVLLDLTTPDGANERDFALWKERLPEVRLLFFDERVRDVNLRMALKLRAAGYVTKSDSFAEILAAVRLCAAGGTFFTDEVRRRLQSTPRGWMLNHYNEPGLHSLTHRETQVLSLLAQGQSVKQCSQTLGISPSTVDNHKARVMKKLKIHKTVELARLALREGLTFE